MRIFWCEGKRTKKRRNLCIQLLLLLMTSDADESKRTGRCPCRFWNIIIRIFNFLAENRSRAWHKKMERLLSRFSRNFSCFSLVKTWNRFIQLFEMIFTAELIWISKQIWMTDSEERTSQKIEDLQKIDSGQGKFGKIIFFIFFLLCFYALHIRLNVFVVVFVFVSWRFAFSSENIFRLSETIECILRKLNKKINEMVQRKEVAFIVVNIKSDQWSENLILSYLNVLLVFKWRMAIQTKIKRKIKSSALFTQEPMRSEKKTGSKREKCWHCCAHINRNHFVSCWSCFCQPFFAAVAADVGW